MKNYLSKLLPGAICVLLLVASCKKDNQAPDNEYQSSLDYSLASSEFAGIATMMDVEGSRDTSITGKTTGSGLYCPGSTITIDILSSTQVKLTVDFGSGVTCVDGKLRTGKIIGTFNGKWWTPGAYVDIVPDNYTVTTASGSYSVLFNKKITYNGVNTDGHKNYTTVVTNGQVITTTGTIQWEETRQTEWIKGDGNFDPTDNEYLVTGNGNGTSRTGITFIVTVDEALHVKANCPNIVEGKLSLTPTGFQTRTIDYGLGACDKDATLIIGSWSTPITLP